MQNRADKEADEIKRLLRRAAEIATAHSMKSQEFVLAAFQEFLACNPRMKDAMEQKAMREEFEAARRQGKLALA